MKKIVLYPALLTGLILGAHSCVPVPLEDYSEPENGPVTNTLAVAPDWFRAFNESEGETGWMGAEVLPDSYQAHLTNGTYSLSAVTNETVGMDTWDWETGAEYPGTPTTLSPNAGTGYSLFLASGYTESDAFTVQPVPNDMEIVLNQVPAPAFPVAILRPLGSKVPQQTRAEAETQLPATFQPLYTYVQRDIAIPETPPVNITARMQPEQGLMGITITNDGYFALLWPDAYAYGLAQARITIAGLATQLSLANYTHSGEGSLMIQTMLESPESEGGIVPGDFLYVDTVDESDDREIFRGWSYLFGVSDDSPRVTVTLELYSIDWKYFPPIGLPETNIIALTWDATNQVTGFNANKSKGLSIELNLTESEEYDNYYPPGPR